MDEHTTIHVRTKADTRALLERAACQAELSLSAWIRERCKAAALLELEAEAMRGMTPEERRAAEVRAMQKAGTFQGQPISALLGSARARQRAQGTTPQQRLEAKYGLAPEDHIDDSAPAVPETPGSVAIPSTKGIDDANGNSTSSPPQGR